MASINLGTATFASNGSSSYTHKYSGYNGGTWKITGATYDTSTKTVKLTLTYNRSGYNSQGVYVSINNDRKSMGNSANYRAVASGWGSSVGAGEYYAVRKTSTQTVVISSSNTSNIAYLKTDGGASSGEGVTGVTATVSAVVDPSVINGDSLPIHLQAIYSSGWKAINSDRWIGTTGSYSQRLDTTVTFANTIPTYTLDVNGRLDGSDAGNTSGYGTFDVYINGSAVATGVSDYCTAHPQGTTYEIKNISAATGKTYNGVVATGVSGTIDSNLDVRLNFTTNQYYFDLNGSLDGTSQNSISPMGTADITIGGTKVLSGGTDYYQQHPYGSSYTVNNIKTNAGYTYSGNSSYTGTITGATSVSLPYTKNSYTVSYNANGGTSTPSTQTAKYQASVTLASAIARNNSDSNVTITVSYNANGGSGAPSASTGTAVNTTPYTFKNWALNSASGTQYGAGTAYTIPAANSVMYATWNTGTTTRKSNPSITLSSTKPTRSGYNFKGWSTSSTATTASYSAGTAYTFSANTTLYAVWELAQASAWIKQNGAWIQGRVWVKVNGTWVQGKKIHGKVSGTWTDTSSCLDGNTLIYTTRGLTPIKELNINDEVYSYNPDTNMVEISTIGDIQTHKVTESYVIELESGEQIIATQEHPFYVDTNWVTVAELQVGMSLITDKQKQIKITGINLDTAARTVYNIDVIGNDNYYIGNSKVLVHNKGDK